MMPPIGMLPNGELDLVWPGWRGPGKPAQTDVLRAERVRQLKQREADEERQRHRERLTAERDALAEKLREIYPQFVTRVSELLAHIQACDREAQQRGISMTSAEYVARGLSDPVQNGWEVPSIVRSARLPAWEPSVHEPFAWPWSR